MTHLPAAHRTAVGIGLLYTVMEVVDGFLIDFPPPSIVYVVLVLGAIGWSLRRRAGLVALAALMVLALGLVLFPFGGLTELLTPTSVADVLRYLAFVVVDTLGAIAAILALRRAEAPSAAAR